MKYVGSVTVLDDEGNIVFERELSDDEIVESLLAGIPDSDEQIQESSEPEIPSPSVHRALRGNNGCNECGSKTRHKNGCSKAKSNGSPKARAATKEEVKATLRPERVGKSTEVLTKDQWEQVREMRDFDDKSSLFIANEIGLSLQQVNYALLSPKYEIYLRNANRAD